MQVKQTKKHRKQCPQCSKTFMGRALRVYCSEFCADQAYWQRRKNREAGIQLVESSDLQFSYGRLVAWLRMQQAETAAAHWRSELENDEKTAERVKGQAMAYEAILHAIAEKEFWR